MGIGNNAELVRRVLRNRDHWVEYVPVTTAIAVESTLSQTLSPQPPASMMPQQSCYNFRWSQTIGGVKYEKLGSSMKQCVNHFEEHREISEKD